MNRTALLPATVPLNFGPTHLGTPARTATGNFCHGNIPPLPFRTASSRVTEVTSRTALTFPYPPPIYSRCAERPGVQSLCLEEFLETLLSSDQGRRDFSGPTTPTAKREPRQIGRTGGRVSSRLYRWHITLESLLIRLHAACSSDLLLITCVLNAKREIFRLFALNVMRNFVIF